jgi:redox-regulated HSP33 family molecular chaperone
LEVDETACLFGIDLWDIVKGYAGIRGVSKTAALLKQVLTPASVLEKYPRLSESHRWLDIPRILPERTYISDVMDDWLWGKHIEDEDGEEIREFFFKTEPTPTAIALRNIQNFRMNDILEEWKNEERRQIGVEQNFEYRFQCYCKKELLRLRLKLLGEDQDEYKLVRQNAFIQFHP